MKQGVLNIQPFSISLAETNTRQSIPYTPIFDVQPSKHKRKIREIG